MAALYILVLLSALGVALVKADCVPVSCGSKGAYMEEGAPRPLQPGEVTVESVDPYLCAGATVVGFDALICEDNFMPKVTCIDPKSVMVDKNGGSAGTIQFTAQCVPSGGGSSENMDVKQPSRYGGSQETQRYYDLDYDRSYRYSSRYNSNRYNSNQYNSNRYNSNRYNSNRYNSNRYSSNRYNPDRYSSYYGYRNYYSK